ncbi:MAG TPA: hypothetical protein VMS99_02925 [Acidimicrobiia bacterium]|nr:hypothetical protein [Acidimicrobiia bacterium]
MDAKESWDRLLAGELSDVEVEILVGDTIQELEAFLLSHPDLRTDVVYVLDEWHKDPLDDLSWDRLKDRLGSYLGLNSAHLLSWLSWLRVADREVELEKMSSDGSPAVMGFMRFIVAVYGGRIRKAMVAERDLADDWQSIALNVFHDQIGQFYRLRLSLTKTNGEVVLLEGLPDSIMTLTHQLVLMLKAVDRSAFAPEPTAEFVEELDGLLASLRGDDQVGAG